MTGTLAEAVLRAQGNYRVAWERHRREQNDESRLALAKAERELDELQRVAVHVTGEVVEVGR